MRIPKHFKHKGKRWRVVFEDNLTHDDGTKCDGLADSETRTISIDSSLGKKAAYMAYVHELFHVIVHEAHVIEDTPLTEHIEDILAEAFTDMILDMFEPKRKRNEKA